MDVKFKQITVRPSNGSDDLNFAIKTHNLIKNAAKQFDVAVRPIELLERKIKECHSVFAFEPKGELVGFVYYAKWSDNFISHSGMVVDTVYRGHGIGKTLKNEITKLSLEHYPDAKIFGITGSKIIQHISKSLGFIEVPFSELTADPVFWAGCKGCKKYEQYNKESIGGINPIGERCCCMGLLKK